MNQQAQNQVVQTVTMILDELGARFGETGAALWQALVGYEFAYALGMLLTLLFSLICLSVAISLLLSKANKVVAECENENHKYRTCDCDFPYLLTAAVFGIGLIAVGLALATTAPDSIATLISPEGAVLRNILP